jgi:raffinose/stachyose/melibiose transport system permease protein
MIRTLKERSHRRRVGAGTIVLTVLVGVLALLFLTPFYFTVSNSLKTFGEIMRDASSLPKPVVTENYTLAFKEVNFPLVFFNSFVITTISLVFMVLFGAMAAWRMVRRPHRLSKILFGAFVVAMVVPFQSVMIPMMRVASGLRLLDSRYGLIIIYLGFGMPFTVFLLHGFAKSVPMEIEESAYLDGASTMTTFFRIVIPLLKTMLATVTILQTFWIWNDFLLPLLVLFSDRLKTIPLAIFGFFGQYNNQWDKALATLNMGMLPIVLFFLFLQRFIIKGVTAGSLKG